MSRFAEPGWRTLVQHERRGIWIKRTEEGIEVCAGRDGDDLHLILPRGQALPPEQVSQLADLLDGYATE